MKVCAFRDHCHKKHNKDKMFKRFGAHHGRRHGKGMRDWQVYFGQCQKHGHGEECRKFKKDGHHKHHECQHFKHSAYVGKRCCTHGHPNKDVVERCENINRFCHHGRRSKHGFQHKCGHHVKQAEAFDCSKRNNCRCGQAKPEDHQTPGPSCSQPPRPKSV